jgi:23S rRNA (uridine2552-2'-O)-methyltransferase
MTRRSKSSRQWLQEHFTDPFVKRAQSEGWRSRAVFKLEEIDRKERLLKPG